MVYVLGVNPGNNCSASLLKDGEIIASARREILQNKEPYRLSIISDKFRVEVCRHRA